MDSTDAEVVHAEKLFRLSVSQDSQAAVELIRLAEADGARNATVRALLWRLRTDAAPPELDRWLRTQELEKAGAAPGLVVLALRSGTPEMQDVAGERFAELGAHAQRWVLRELAARHSYSPTANFQIQLKNKIASPHPALRDAAAFLLARCDPKTVTDYLKRELHDLQPARVANLAAIAGVSGRADALNLVSGFLKLDGMSFSSQVVMGLEQYPSPALAEILCSAAERATTPELQELYAPLLARNPNTRSNAILAKWVAQGHSNALNVLESRRDDAALELLKRGLASDSVEMRHAAATALSTPTDAEYPELAKLLQEYVAKLPPEDPLWPGLAKALACSGAKVAIDVLAPFEKFPSPEIRSTLCEALGLLRSPAAVEILTRLMADADAQVQSAAALGLSKHLRGSNTTQALRALSENVAFLKFPASMKVVHAVSKIDSPEALAILERGLNHSDPAVQRRTLEGIILSNETTLDFFALRNPSPCGWLKSIRRLAKSENPALRSPALVALKRTGLADVQTAVLDALTDKDKRVRNTAVFCAWTFYDDYPMAAQPLRADLTAKISNYRQTHVEESREFEEYLRCIEAEGIAKTPAIAPGF